MNLMHYFAARRWLLLSVVGSAVFTGLHAGPLYGTDAALVLTVLLQFYLSGYVLVRALRVPWSDNTLTNFAWVLLAAFGLNVSLAGLVRLLQIPAPVYAPILYGTLLVLALLAPPRRGPLTRFGRPSFRRLVLSGVVVFCCVIVTWVALQRSQYRFSDYEDQTVFVELADWLAHDSGDVGLRSRRVGVTSGDNRWDTDGWTYTHAVWIWTSGVPAADLIWFRLTPLFVWAVPLSVYALAYELTRREEAATWTTAALTVIGLLTVDSLVYYPTTITFGQFSLFQVNSLRTIATALVTPLALIPAVRYLSAPSRRVLVLLLLVGVALAFMHPRPAVIVIYSTGAMAALNFLAKPTHQRAKALVYLGAVLVLLLAVPFLQRLYRPAGELERVNEVTAAGDESTAPEQDEPDSSADAVSLDFASDEQVTGFHVSVIDYAPRARMLGLSNVPVIGDTVILDPSFVFYHPLFLILTWMGLVIGLAWWRRHLAAQYILGATVVSLALLFVPVLAAVFIRLVTPIMAAGAILGVPFALIFGLTVEYAVNRLGQTVRSQAAGTVFGGVALALAVVWLLFEPTPLAASARDQIRASNLMQATRDARPSDLLLADDLRYLLPPGQTNVVVSPNRVANFISESVPGALITGGRATDNDTFDLTQVFLAEHSKPRPWLTTEEFDTAARWGVTHVVMPADNWRVAQLMLMPEQFELLGVSTGYFVFQFHAGAIEDMPPVYEAMNQRIVQQEGGRWRADGFDWSAPPNPTGWADLVAELENLPQDDSVLFARAFAQTMMGDDTNALALWTQLHERYPDVPLFAETAASNFAALGQPENGHQLLMDALTQASLPARLLAARALLTPAFFYLLSDAELDTLLALVETNPAAWDLLAQVDQLTQVRERVALLMSASRWNLAAQWLRALPEIERTPADLVTLATLEWVLGRTDSALALLAPARDADWTKPNRRLHPDRWENNIAAQTYDLLQGEIALDAGRVADAVASFEEAVIAGNGWAGNVLLAQAHRLAGNGAAAEALETSLATAWRETYGTELPGFTGLLALADSPNPYVVNATVHEEDSPLRMRVSAYFGDPMPQALPVESWLFQVINPDTGETYARTELPALTVPGALVESAALLELPAGVPELTPALLVVEPRHDNRVTFEPAILPVVLNRPGPVDAMNAEAVGARFGDAILLEAFHGTLTPDALCLTLYWQADQPVMENYQVFVHVVNEAGELVAQVDAAPVNGRYPTSWWRTETRIADPYRLNFASPLPDGDYRVVAGMYALDTLARLPVTAGVLPTDGDAVTLMTRTPDGGATCDDSA